MTVHSILGVPHETLRFRDQRPTQTLLGSHKTLVIGQAETNKMFNLETRFVS
jgi:hypothetical protein